MKIDSNYIDKHISMQEAIKLRAIEINNFLSDVELDSDWRDFQYCGVREDCLDCDINQQNVTLFYEEWDMSDEWEIPTRLFDLSDQELLQWAKDQAASYDKTTSELEYMRLKQQAEALGYKLIKEDDNEN